LKKKNSEITIIELFLPNQKNEDETKEIVEQIIKENNFVSIKDMGKLMNIIKTNYLGQVDMAVVGKIAKLTLGK